MEYIEKHPDKDWNWEYLYDFNIIDDKFILENNNQRKRVLNIQNPFNEAKTSYYHSSIGGYHGAKLRRYQDLIENIITDERSKLISKIQNNNIDFSDLNTLNMLNTGYIKFNESKKGVIKNNFSIINSLLILSFFLFNTFFLISLFPPILGQPFNSRFLTILLPFSFISVIIFLKIIIDKSSHNFLSFLLICIVLLTFFSRPVYSLLKIDEDWGYLSLLSHKNNSVWDRYEQFDKLYNEYIY